MFSLAKITTLDSITSPHIFQFSQWMKGSGVAPDAVFAVSKVIVESQNDNLHLYAIQSDSKTIGYLAHFLSPESYRYTRIQYFTIDPTLRHKGLGTKVLKEVIEQLIMPVDVITVVCNSGLRPFYEHCGFESAGPAEDSQEFLFYSEQPVHDIDRLGQVPITIGRV